MTETKPTNAELTKIRELVKEITASNTDFENIANKLGDSESPNSLLSQYYNLKHFVIEVEESHKRLSLYLMKIINADLIKKQG